MAQGFAATTPIALALPFPGFVDRTTVRGRTYYYVVEAEDGTVWMSGSRWQDRAVLRVSVSNWSSDDEDVRISVDAVRRAVEKARL